jgi:hypothetical protein
MLGDVDAVWARDALLDGDMVAAGVLVPVFETGAAEEPVEADAEAVERRVEDGDAEREGEGEAVEVQVEPEELVGLALTEPVAERVGVSDCVPVVVVAAELLTDADADGEAATSDMVAFEKGWIPTFQLYTASATWLVGLIETVIDNGDPLNIKSHI